MHTSISPSVPWSQHVHKSFNSNWYLVIRCTGLIKYACSGNDKPRSFCTVWKMNGILLLFIIWVVRTKWYGQINITKTKHTGVHIPQRNFRHPIDRAFLCLGPCSCNMSHTSFAVFQPKMAKQKFLPNYTNNQKNIICMTAIRTYPSNKTMANIFR